jgi:hypothetical protein
VVTAVRGCSTASCGRPHNPVRPVRHRGGSAEEPAVATARLPPVTGGAGARCRRRGGPGGVRCRHPCWSSTGVATLPRPRTREWLDGGPRTRVESAPAMHTHGRQRPRAARRRLPRCPASPMHRGRPAEPALPAGAPLPAFPARRTGARSCQRSGSSAPKRRAHDRRTAARPLPRTGRAAHRRPTPPPAILTDGNASWRRHQPDPNSGATPGDPSPGPPDGFRHIASRAVVTVLPRRPSGR